MNEYDLVLASASPRRQELLKQIAVKYRVEVQDIDETPLDDEAALEYVRRMACQKAQSALGKLSCDSTAMVLAADTVVVCDQLLMGKPNNQQQALLMLSKLSGREHRVLSAICLCNKQESESLVSESMVRFRQITEQEAVHYWQSGEPLGKAGSYAIQGYGAVFIEQLEGSYSGVMGLPLYETALLLGKFGINCINNLRKEP